MEGVISDRSIFLLVNILGFLFSAIGSYKTLTKKLDGSNGASLRWRG